MKPRAILSFIVLLCLILPAFAGDQADVSLSFSPRGGCQSIIVDAIDAAELDIQIAAYSFSSKPIAAALYRAAKRGIVVRVLLDRRQPTAHYSMADEMISNRLIVRVDRKVRMMHMKTICIDSKTAILGSYNFTASAENRNAEVLCVIDSPAVAAKLSHNWFFRWQGADPHTKAAKKNQPVKKSVTLPTYNDNNCPTGPSDNLNPFVSRRKKRWSK